VYIVFTKEVTYPVSEISYNPVLKKQKQSIVGNKINPVKRIIDKNAVSP